MSKRALFVSVIGLLALCAVAYSAFAPMFETSWKCRPGEHPNTALSDRIIMICTSGDKVEQVGVHNHALNAIYAVDISLQKRIGRRSSRLDTTCEGTDLETAFCEVFMVFKGGGRRPVRSFRAPEFVWEGYPCELESISGVGNSSADGTCKSGIFSD